ncbi:MAG: beta-ketoacyl-[acyl-carrier-protein] synthase family protein [Deltaproteobacteria bacterium]|nr:beta-ketoacyl-[acyl-carrier-protein] synthase family protein [Deltaproteobacteria bacterium]
MVKDAVILGYDAVSPLGTDLETQWDRAAGGESGIGPLTRFPMTDAFPVRIAGEVGEWDRSPYPFLSPRKLAQWTSPIFEHAMLVAHRALLKSGVTITPEVATRTAITFSSAVGGVDAVLAADRRMIKEGRMPHPFTNSNACVNMVGGKISILTGATGPITATITACATGVTSMIVGKMLLDQNRADLVICGAVDFPLVEPIVAGFYTMNGAYRPKEGQPPEPPERASRPFSIDRRGFVVSEGAGCVILATRDFADAHGLPYGIELAGWSMTSDAQHFVAPNFETVRRAISEAILNAGIQPDDISCVNAHATATRMGDQVEFDALTAVFGERIPPVCANKSLTGHCMGASSAIESILAMDGMQKGILLPTINYTPDHEMALDCVAEGARLLNQEFVLKNAFGFGGCNACVVFRKIC